MIITLQLYKYWFIPVFGIFYFLKYWTVLDARVWQNLMREIHVKVISIEIYFQLGLGDKVFFCKTCFLRFEVRFSRGVWRGDLEWLWVTLYVLFRLLLLTVFRGSSSESDSDVEKSRSSWFSSFSLPRWDWPLAKSITLFRVSLDNFFRRLQGSSEARIWSLRAWSPASVSFNPCSSYSSFVKYFFIELAGVTGRLWRNRVTGEKKFALGVESKADIQICMSRV